MAPDHSSRPRVADDVAWALVDNEVVAFEAMGPAVHLLSASAAMLWQCFDGTTTISELASDVAAAFQLSGDRALADVSNFTLEMLALRLLTLNEWEPDEDER